jgi:hypothetical protein
MLADVPRPSFAPDLAAWAPNSGALGPSPSSLASPRGPAASVGAQQTGGRRASTAGLGAGAYTRSQIRST